MQRELTSILGALAVLLMAYVPSMRAEDTERRTLVAMKSSIQKGDLAQFIQTVAEKKWQPVAIASAWYVENRVPKEQRPDEADKRAFGKLLEERVAALATQLAAATEPDRLRKDSETLLALADWCEGAKGYGNLILAARCRDVATVGVGKLLANLDYPLEKSVALVASLSTPAPAERARVLNREVGAELFPSASQQGLEDVWRSGEILWREQQNPDLKAARLGNAPKELEALTKVIQDAKPNIIETPAIKSNLNFFKDDDAATLNRPPTTANTWDRKRHRLIVDGLESANVTRLRALTKFRSVVGSFPTEPVKHAFLKGGEAAFDKAWRPHSTKEEYHLSAVAWRAYEAIQKGEFFDEDTQMLRAQK